MNDSSFFSTRRSIRNYDRTRHIGRDLLKKILEEASHAPSTGNMQLYSVIVVEDEDRKKALAPAHFNQPSVTGCDVLLTFCIDINRFKKWCEANDAVPGMNNFQSFVYSLIDTVIFAQQTCTIAEMQGIGTCYMGTTTYNAPDIARILELPEGVVPVATVTMGYPAGDSATSDRLPIESIIHYDRYHDYTPEDIKKAYEYKESLKENEEFVKLNNKQTLAQVYTDIRYTKHDNEYFSKVLFDFLDKCGFPAP